MQFRAIVSGISVIRHHTQGQGLYKTGTVTGTVRGPARRPHFSLAIVSVTVQLWT